MRWPCSVVVWATLTGCADGGPETPAIPETARPERLSLEVVEGETVVVPVRYRVLASLAGESAWIGFEASYGTASAQDILLMKRTGLRTKGTGEKTVELALLARVDGAPEGTERLVLRPVVGDWGLDPNVEHFIQVQEAEIEVEITDGPAPCSGVEVQVGEPVWSRDTLEDLVFPWDISYTVEFEIGMPMESEQVLGWLSPPDWDEHFGWNTRRRTREFTAWRVEHLGERVRHRITARWWSGRGGPLPPLLDLQVCGGPGYGRFIRCSPTECAVHDEGF